MVTVLLLTPLPLLARGAESPSVRAESYYDTPTSEAAVFAHVDISNLSPDSQEISLTLRNGSQLFCYDRDSGVHFNRVLSADSIHTWVLPGRAIHQALFQFHCYGDRSSGILRTVSTSSGTILLPGLLLEGTNLKPSAAIRMKVGFSGSFSIFVREAKGAIQASISLSNYEDNWLKPTYLIFPQFLPFNGGRPF